MPLSFNSSLKRNNHLTSSFFWGGEWTAISDSLTRMGTKSTSTPDCGQDEESPCHIGYRIGDGTVLYRKIIRKTFLSRQFQFAVCGNKVVQNW